MQSRRIPPTAPQVSAAAGSTLLGQLLTAITPPSQANNHEPHDLVQQQAQNKMEKSLHK